jgi:hypothetical protein
MRELTTSDVARARQVSLLLWQAPPRSAVDVVTWFGAMQAQDIASAKWSLGVRVPGSTENDVDEAIGSGAILRTWPMRGTIHLIPAGDARWLLETTGARALATSARRREQLGLDLASADAAVEVLRAALAGGRRLRRSQAIAAIADAGIPTAGQAGYHLLWYAAQVGATCIGPHEGKEQTFALLEEFAPEQRRLERREAIAELALRYFRGHGPATVRDFAGWTGLTLADCRMALGDNAGRLVAASFAGTAVHLTAELADQIVGGATRGRAPTTALPGFDEFILGYKDRTVQVPAGGMAEVVPGGNGMFRATLCTDGVAVGTWTRRLRTGRVDIDVRTFEQTGERLLRQAEQPFAGYASFLDRTPVVTYLPR